MSIFLISKTIKCIYSSSSDRCYRHISSFGDWWRSVWGGRSTCGVSSRPHYAFLQDTWVPRHRMQCWLFLYVVVGRGSSVFDLHPGENEPLLVWRNTFPVLNPGLEIVDRTATLDLERDRLSQRSASCSACSLNQAII